MDREIKRKSLQDAIDITKIYAGSSDQKVGLDLLLETVYKKLQDLRHDAESSG
jgi:hypothetical protein